MHASENDDSSLTGSQADLPNYDSTGRHLILNKNPRSGQSYFNTNRWKSSGHSATPNAGRFKAAF